MAYPNKVIKMKPIGFVSADYSDQEVKNKEIISDIVLKKNLTKSLDGIEGFSHIFVLFWLDRITEKQRKITMVHPRGKKELPLRGVFATRTMLRPNPIGLTIVELVKVKENILTVRGLDAFNGTPVLDVKPYDKWDIAKGTRVPNWWNRLEEIGT